MEKQTEVIDLSDYSKDEILEKVREILQDSYIQKFTLLIKREVHRSKSQKKLKQKENAIQNVKYRYSVSSNNNLLLGKQNNILNIKPSYPYSPGLKITPSIVRTPDKKGSKISSLLSRRASKMNESLFNLNTKIDEIPRSLQLYYEGQFQMALIQFFDQQKQLKKKIAECSQDQHKLDRLTTEYARVMVNIGNCYFGEKDYEKAMKYYKKELTNSKIDEKLLGQIYNNLGSCYAHKKQNQQSLKCFNEALKIYARFSELDCANLLKNIGIIYFRSGMFSSAESYFQQSIQERKAKSPDNQEALLITYYKLGLCQKHLAKFQEAISNFLFGLNIAQKGYPLHDDILKQLALIYEGMERYSQALIYYEKLSDNYQRKEQCQGEIYQNVARIHQKLRNFSQHNKFMKLALGQYRRTNNQRKLSELMSSQDET